MDIRKTMKTLAAAAALAALPAAAHATKAYPHPVAVPQPDGTSVTLVLHGDADFAWRTTADGVVVAEKGGAYYVAAILPDGTAEPTGLLAHDPGQRTAAEQAMADAQPKGITDEYEGESRRMAERRRISIARNASPAYFPHTGKPKALVILVDFNDTTFTVPDPAATFRDYLNAEGQGAIPDRGHREDRNHGSVGQYFKDMSFGAFTPQFDVYGPYRMPQKSSWYGYGAGNNKGRITQLITDACKAADPDADFAQYDSDGDGLVDLVYVIYAGYAESWTGNTEDCIWPQSGTVAGISCDGKSVSRYGINNELNYSPVKALAEPRKRVNGIGLFCHEFSHAMGLPDFYPYADAARINNQTMEYWDLMDGGEYVDNGYTPTPYTPWEREAMGWMEPVEIETAGTYTMKTLADGGCAYKIGGGDSQYVLLENIQQTGWHSKQLGHGMLVYRVDYGRGEVNSGDRPNDTPGSPSMTIVPADGLLITSYLATAGKVSEKYPHTQQEYADSHAGDTYPGTSGVKSIGSFAMNRGVVLEKPIYNIAEKGGVVTFDFLEDSVATGVAAAAARNTGGEAYTLDGRRAEGHIGTLPKGVYVIGGRKVVVR